MKVNPNYKTVNVDAQENDPQSVLTYFRKIVQLRKNNLTLVYGKYTLLDKDNPNVYAYTREGDGKKMLILLNFSAQNATANLKDMDVSTGNLLLGNYADAKVSKTLRPYEAMIIGF